MKKLLSVLAVIGLTATTTSTAVSCGCGEQVTRKELKTLITVSDLGEIEDNMKSTIISAIIEKNKATAPTEKDFQIELIDLSTRALATGIGLYEGTVIINFSLPPVEKPLSVMITEPELGAINNNQPATILKAIIDKNPDADENVYELEADSITKTGATATAKEHSGFNGSVNVTFNVRIQLDTIITEQVLERISNTSDSTVKAAIKSKNSKVTEAMYDLVANAAGVAKLTGKGDYQGDVNVYYATDIYKIELEHIVPVQQLGYIFASFRHNADLATRLKNPKLDRTLNYDYEEDPTSSYYDIYGRGDYSSQVRMYFQVSDNIRDLIAVKELGVLPDNNYNTIKDAVEKLNNGVSEFGLDNKSITETTAIVQHASNSTGSDITVHFTIG